jgi:hypothetical protein
MEKIFMRHIKTFENFSNENNDIFNQYPTDLRDSLSWKGLLSENDKFSKFFFYSDSDSVDEVREKIFKVSGFEDKGSDDKQKIFSEMKLLSLKEHWSKMWISIEDIIKENNVSLFTHVSLSPNLSTSSIKNSMNPISSNRAETLEDKEKGDKNIKNKWGFYISTYDENEKTDWDTLSYMARASEDINSIFVYSINIKPGSKFLRADYFDFKMISEMDEDSMNLVKNLGLSGVYSERPYGEDKLEPEFDEKGEPKTEYDEKGNVRFVGKYYKHSSLEICVVDIDCIQSIKKDDNLKKKSIQQMSKEPKYSTGAHSGNKLIK